MRGGVLVVLTLLGLTLAGCQDWQSAAHPRGPEARHLNDLFWLFTWLLGAIWLAVMVAVALAVFQRGRRRTVDPADPLNTNERAERRYTSVVWSLAVATGVVVVALSVLTFFSQRELFGHKGEGINIRITGHQWWWEIRYEDPRPDHIVTTANEFTVPVGKPITIKLNAEDVIHSFWVPSLMGKQDLIPGRENLITFTIDRPGIYRGQCAEFCGLQHAHMGMLIHAVSDSEFDAWQAAQVQDAASPDTPERRQGQELFQQKPCVMCHQVRGTQAASRVGPELTHVASRRYLAAGTVPMSRGNLAAWIVDPHGIKPGVNMPLIKLEPDELNAISAYLEGLK
jgi:cytochrome c oxidase subunit 2